jgi:ribosomal protein S27E
MIPFQCDKCGYQQLVKPDLAGKKVQCPKCGQISQVSGARVDPSGRPAAGAGGPSAQAPSDVGASSEITKFRCSKCDQKLGVKAKPGQSVRCSKCGEVVKVPRVGGESGTQRDLSTFTLLDLTELERTSPGIPSQSNKLPPVPPPNRQSDGGDRIYGVAPVVMDDCPFCGREILASATKCKHCGGELAARHRGAISQPASPSFSSFVPNEGSRLSYYLTLMPRWVTMLLIIVVVGFSYWLYAQWNVGLATLSNHIAKNPEERFNQLEQQYNPSPSQNVTPRSHR